VPGDLGEVLGEALGVDRGAGDDDLQVATLLNQAPQVAQQEVDIQRPLVGIFYVV
jgi:hypothetical protein